MSIILIYNLTIYNLRFISRLECLDGDDGALAADDAHGGAHGDECVGRADGAPLVAINLHVAVAAYGDGLCHLACASYQGIGVGGLVGIVLVQPAQGYGSHEEHAEQREYGKEEDLPIDAEAGYGAYDGEDGSDGEADDEEVARREFENQAQYGHDDPYLPHVLDEIV